MTALNQVPAYLMAKPVGAMCNLACKYCYYLEKKALYPDRKRPRMTEATLEKYIKQTIAAQPGPCVQFTWHGGEATLMPLPFYRRAIELQKVYGQGRMIENSFQTNGILLNDEWCQFLKKNNWLVGISIDGPEEMHDAYRASVDDRSTWSRVMMAINRMNRHGVEWNAMAVVNDINGDHPSEFYQFFCEIGCKYLQFTPIVERVGGEIAHFSVSPQQWGAFLCGVFDQWVRRDVGQRFVQIFDATLANWVGELPGVCTMAQTCGHAMAMEHNGDVYACDHFVDRAHYRGNIHTGSLIEMVMSEEQQAFGRAKFDSLSVKCRSCRWLKICNGECPKNRFVDSTGEPQNYLCAGYQQYFAHVAPAMDFMASQLHNQLPPAAIMSNLPLIYGKK